jgi:hypothetical protein
MDNPSAGLPRPGSRYHLVVEGELGPEWREWFAAERVQVHGGTTLIELRIRDQAELHGVLRRVHDLHLRLVSLTRSTPSPNLKED